VIKGLAAFVAPLAVVGTVACTGSEDAGRTTEREAESVVFALLADRTLVGISPTSRRIVLRKSVGPGTPLADPGRFLVLSNDGQSLLVLTPDTPGAGQQVTILARAGLRPVESFPLDRRIVFRAIAVGPRTGRLYLFGNRAAGGGAEDAVVAILDPNTGDTRTSTIRKADGYDWWIFDAAVSADERRLYVAYHGGCSGEDVKLCTSGADWIDVAGDRLKSCGRRTVPGNGCLVRVHGNVEALDKELLAATGGEPIVEFSSEGDVTASRRTRLPGNHLMEFELTSDTRRAYAVGQCYYTGGISVVDLANGRSRVLNRDVCGERIAVGGDLLAVAEQARASPLGVPSRIAIVDASTGSARYVNVPVETVDVLIVPPR
jgi:hypothetical protein